MAISHLGSAKANGTHAAAISVTLPTHPSGDLRLAHRHAGGNTIAATSVFSVSVATGWTKLYDVANAADGRDKQQACFYKIAVGGVETNPPFDPSTQALADRPAYDVLVERVTETYHVRQLSAEELQVIADKAARKSGQAALKAMPDSDPVTVGHLRATGLI